MDRPGALGRPAPDMIGEPLDTSAAIVLTDPGGRVTAWSTGARRLLGYAPAEIIGSLAADLFVSAPDFPAGKQVEQGRPREKQGGGQEQGRPREERDGPQEQTRHTAVVRHRDGHRLTAEVLTAPLIEGDSRAGVLLLFTPDASQATHGDDRLMRWLFTQSPVGLVIYGRDRKLLRANDEMERKIEHQEDDVHGLRPSEILEGPGLEGRIDHVVATGEHDSLECYVKVPGEDRAHAWVMDLFPLKDDTGYVHAVAVAVFDYSQQYGSRERLAVLDEARTRIGTSLDVTGTAHELAEVAVPRFADSITVELLDSVFRGDQPPPLPPGGVTLRRAAHVSGPADLTETVSGPGDGPGPAPGETHFHTEPSPPARCLLTSQAVVHQATDPEIAVWLAADPVQAEQARRHGLHSLIAAPLKARGKDLGVVLLVRHTASREPFTEDDLFVTENLVARAAICMDNARRYAREHGIALALQRSLLAYRPEAQHAVDVASRYLPSESGAGVGGDWFDVIPLPCARVGLVVGDVVGHGINASAAMGRLRTAVRTLADIDLPPDELLTHLDDIVTHATPEGDADSGEIAADLGATCLYAIYDPVSRHLTLATAGHPAPALVSPGGTVQSIDLPTGPPLGLGSLPFEAAELEIPEGTSLVLFTDGLLEARNRDVDEGLETLRHSLEHPTAAPTPSATPSPEALCDSILEAMLPAPGGRAQADDIALVIARTRALDENHVAQWDLTRDPAIVAEAREHASRQLTTWGVDNAVFTTELVVSELVTNAIRHATDPIQLRLIRQPHSLICEVSDGSATTPHLRRARLFDEGGRGLLLVAQLTPRWGTRHQPGGKTIWAEQSLSPAP
ncbi:SpoIIE family protein phosphatase [Streptomyces antimycoticus]